MNQTADKLQEIYCRLPDALQDDQIFRTVFLDLMKAIGATQYLICQRSGTSTLMLPYLDQAELENCPLLSDFGGPAHRQLYFDEVDEVDFWGSREQALPCHEAVFMSDITHRTLGENARFDNWLEQLAVGEVIFVKLCEMRVGCLGLNFYLPRAAGKPNEILDLVSSMSRRLAPFMEPYFKGYSPVHDQHPEAQIMALSEPALLVNQQSEIVLRNDAANHLLSKIGSNSEAPKLFSSVDHQLLFERASAGALNLNEPSQFKLFYSHKGFHGTVYVCSDHRLNENHLFVTVEENPSASHLLEKEIDKHLLNFAIEIGVVINKNRPPFRTIQVLKCLIMRYRDEEIVETLDMGFERVRDHIGQQILGRLNDDHRNQFGRVSRHVIPILFENYLHSL